MERKKLDIQPPSIVVPGDYVDITLQDIDSLRNIANADTKSGRQFLDVEIPDALQPFISDIAVQVTEAHPDNASRQILIGVALTEALELPWRVDSDLQEKLNDDDNIPLYTDMGETSDNLEEVQNFYTFDSTTTVHYQITSDGINIFTPLEEGDPAVTAYNIQRAARVASAAIEAVLESFEQAPSGHESITIAIPDNFKVIESVPAQHESAKLESIGGSMAIKRALMERADVFLDRDAAMEEFGLKGNKPFMLYGPPGTGKTTMAEGFAQLIGADFQQVGLTELADKYLGESAKHLKTLFDEAKEASKSGPKVLFFDEFDSISKSKEALHDEYQKLINALKVELTDAIDNYPNLVVVACSNGEMSDQDPALFRAGRMDALYVAYPDQQDREMIWSKILDSNPNLRQDNALDEAIEDALDPLEYLVNLESVESSLAANTKGLSGADIREICNAFLMQSYFAKKRTGNGLEPTKKALLKQVDEYKRQHAHRIVSDDTILD